MAEIISFRDLDAWKVAMELVVASYTLVSKLPSTERYELSAQIRRAAVSIPSNIAEGQANGRGGRYLYHVRIALGSLAELDTQIEAAKRLKLISADATAEVEELLNRTGQLLGGLRRSLWREVLKTAAVGSVGSLLFLAAIML